MAVIKQWMDDTDYFVLKVIRGNWSQDDERYLEYISEYQVQHKRKEEIEKELTEGENYESKWC